MNKKIIIYAGIGLFLTAGVAATNVPPEKPEWKNLKVLPKDMSAELMEQIMHQYTGQLGVTCKYCHSDTKPDVFPMRVDFASDEKPEKLIARNMMRMTEKINRKYFNYKNKYDFETFRNAVVTCKTCHRGITKPNNMKLFNN
jgi:Photosynthetic reaction centre cytochrome C subunit